ncbi:unnamed protein product [Strongylus vulgaris]|uniref:Uncharacterized protein n=1 Tax=Strongylus vulgaris TaxID=40348 RepID=A0A3P7ISG1_STRVU|nr:unnamed protein product [Strongylus vulgaris]
MHVDDIEGVPRTLHENTGELMDLITARLLSPRTSSANPKESDLELKTAQPYMISPAKPKSHVKRPSFLALLENEPDINSADFDSPQSSRISDMQKDSIRQPTRDEEDKNKKTVGILNIKSDKTPSRLRKLIRPFRSDTSLMASDNRLDLQLI